MSVVAAIKDNDRVYIACDSQASTNYTKRTLTNKNNYKIFKPKDDPDIIIGMVGDLRDLNIVYCIESFIDELTKLKDEVDFRYIVKEVVPKLIYNFRENNRIRKPQMGELEYYFNGQIIFIYKNTIYCIDSYGSVTEVDDYCAIGSGANFTMGYLNESKNNIHEGKQESLIKAIKSACKSDLYVNYPIIVKNTYDDSTIIIGE